MPTAWHVVPRNEWNHCAYQAYPFLIPEMVLAQIQVQVVVSVQDAAQYRAVVPGTVQVEEAQASARDLVPAPELYAVQADQDVLEAAD